MGDVGKKGDLAVNDQCRKGKGRILTFALFAYVQL